METRLRAMLAPWSDSVEFLLVDSSHGTLSVATQIMMETVADGRAINQPSFRLDRAAAQELLENLWQCGLRPLNGTGSAGQLAATERHLEDMRRLVFERKEG